MDPQKYRPREEFDSRTTTTLAGAPVTDTTRSLTVGERGPVLLEDFHLLEKLANFHRERIPERVVHARGVTAKGKFICRFDLSNVTSADLFSEVGKVTDVAVRFSTVIHSRHSPETLRDPRGFAVKFYTKEGNWDLVG
jgi:catalase